MTIAVLIPAYNVEKYIGLCLESIIAQTYLDFQVFVMDDGSTDNTFAIATAYAKKDARIHALTQQNRGVTKTRNNLLNLIDNTVDYIFFMDADDMIHPETFSYLIKTAEKTNSDVIECHSCRISAEAESIPSSSDYLNESVPEKTITDMDIFWSDKTRVGPWINAWNKLYRWSSVKNIRFNEELAHEDDYFYGCEVNATVTSKTITPAVLYFYRHNPTSMTGSLNFERYQKSGINRIYASYNTFVKTNRVPKEYLSDFKTDLVNDAYRMIIRKNIKKNKNKTQCRQLFNEASDALNDMQTNSVLEFNRLSILKRLVVFFTIRKYFYPARILSFIA